VSAPSQRRSERAAADGSGAVLEAPAFVAGLDDVAVMGETIEERGRHFGVATTEGIAPYSRDQHGWSSRYTHHAFNLDCDRATS
jgi:hypothetical protein